MIEQDTRFIIDSNLTNRGWILDINNPKKNVFFENDILRIIDNPKLKKAKKRPDYVLVDNNKKPIAIIEAKAGGKDLEKALNQAMDYAQILGAPLIFAMNNSYCQTRHLYTNKPLYINENEVNELVSQKESLKFLEENTNSIYTIPKDVIVSRQELITIFKSLNNTLRGEGLRAGIERLSEFANILFLKLYTENKADNIWDSIKEVDNEILINTVNQILEHMKQKYGVSVFTELQIKKPDTLREIITKLDKLTLSTIDTDIKGDAFEYFLQQATATNNDLGEYFTPRHITKTIVNLVNPKFKETIYDPFCGTGGFLTQAFNHIKDNTIITTEKEKEILKEKTIFGGEITANSRLAKMNMILHGDGHSGVKQLDSLENPIDNKYDIVITNMPFSQKTKTSHLYYNGIAKNNGDGVCLLHCFRAVKKGGRMAVIVPDGLLSTSKSATENVRKFLMDNAVLKTIISLPQGVFEPYTKAKTNILYFTDCHSKKTKDRIWYFDVKNDGFSLDKLRKKISQNDLKKIDYINFSKIDKEDILNLDFAILSVENIKKNSFIWKKESSNIHKTKYSMFKLEDICFEEKILAGKDWEQYPVCTISSLKGGIVRQEEYFKKSIASTSREKYKVIKPKHFGYRPPGLDIGTIGFNRFHYSVIVSPIYNVFNCDENVVNVDFLLKIFQSDSFKEIVKPLMQGTARPSVSFKQFANIKIPVPPLEKQKEIIVTQKNIQKEMKEIKKLERKLKNDIDDIWTQK